MNKQTELFQGYPFPKTSGQEVLLTLILQGNVSIFDYPYLSGFRTRVSDLQLKHGLFLERIKDSRCNKFGNTYTYYIHKLPENQKLKAIDLYHKLNNQ